MASAIRTIALSSDLVILRAFEHFHDQLLRGASTTFEQMEAGLKPVPSYTELVSPLIKLLARNPDQSLNPTDSVDLARRLFVGFVEYPPFEPLVTQCIENWPDNVQRVSTILTVGVVGAVWLCLISTSFTYKSDGVEIQKNAISPEQLRELTKFVQPKIEASLNVRIEPPSTKKQFESATQNTDIREQPSN